MCFSLELVLSTVQYSWLQTTSSGKCHGFNLNLKYNSCLFLYVWLWIFHNVCVDLCFFFTFDRMILKHAERNECVKNAIQTFTKCFFRELSQLQPQVWWIDFSLKKTHIVTNYSLYVLKCWCETLEPYNLRISSSYSSIFVECFVFVSSSFTYWVTMIALGWFPNNYPPYPGREFRYICVLVGWKPVNVCSIFGVWIEWCSLRCPNVSITILYISLHSKLSVVFLGLHDLLSSLMFFSKPWKPLQNSWTWTKIYLYKMGLC